MPHNVLAANSLESSAAEKDLGVLVDAKLSMSQLYTPAAKATDSLLSFIGKSVPSGGGRHIWSAGSSSGLPSRGETGAHWKESNKRP